MTLIPPVQKSQRSKDDWQSPLMPTLQNGTNDDTNPEGVVEIPRNGWYGFFFGFEQTGKGSPDESLSSHHTYSLYLQTGDNQERKQMALPFGHKGSEKLDKQEKPLISLAAGKILWLNQGTRILVVQENNVEKLGHAAAESKPEWKLVSVRFTKQLDKRDNNQHLIENASVIPTSIHTHLICSTCQRFFSSIHGVLCHAHDAHPPAKPLDPMWTTPLNVLYQDHCMAVVEKPQGMSVMGSSQSLVRSDLLLALRNPACNNKDKGGRSLGKPVVCHRLDAPTGGLLVVAKTRVAEAKLKECFANHRCRKRYRALLVGKLEEDQGDCNLSMGGKTAITRYKVLRYARCSRPNSYACGWMTVVDLYPVTGRRHQLRKHMKALGHAIWGDIRYGRSIVADKNDDVHSRLCLWHIEIALPHPLSGQETVFSLDEPEWLNYVIKEEEERRMKELAERSP